MSRRLVSAVAGAVLIVGIAGCSSSDSGDDAFVRSDPVNFTDVTDATTNDAYDVQSNATGISDSTSYYLTLYVTILNPNQTIFDPIATVHLSDGSTVVCRETDLRRFPSIQESTKDWDVPCESDLPDDPSSVSIVVTDDYAN